MTNESFDYCFNIYSQILRLQLRRLRSAPSHFPSTCFSRRSHWTNYLLTFAWSQSRADFNPLDWWHEFWSLILVHSLRKHHSSCRFNTSSCVVYFSSKYCFFSIFRISHRRILESHRILMCSSVSFWSKSRSTTTNKRFFNLDFGPWSSSCCIYRFTYRLCGCQVKTRKKSNPKYHFLSRRKMVACSRSHG